MTFKSNIIPVGSRRNVASSDILYLQSDLNYTKVFLINGKMIFSSTTLKIIEGRLHQNPEFFRINRGIVINRDYLSSYKDGQLQLLFNDRPFMVSRRKKTQFRSSLHLL